MDKDRFEIGPIGEEDLPDIAQVFIEARTRCLAFLNWDYELGIMVDVFRRQRERMTFLTARFESRVVGFVAFESSEIDHLYVLPEFHGCGAGSALLDAALLQCDPEVWLWVFQENSQARAFYERKGFKLEYETDGQDNMEKCPDARYRLSR